MQHDEDAAPPPGHRQGGISSIAPTSDFDVRGGGTCCCECQGERRALEAELRTLQKRVEAMAQISRMENDLLVRKVAEAESTCAATRGIDAEFLRQLDGLRLELVEARHVAIGARCTEL